MKLRLLSMVLAMGSLFMSSIFMGSLALVTPLRASEPPRLIILPFENLTGQRSQDHLREGLADLLTSCLAAHAERVVVLDRSLLADLFAEESLLLEGLLAEGGRASDGRLEGASHLLLGSFGQENGADLWLRGDLYDLQSTQLLFTARSEGSPEELSDSLCGELAPALAEGLTEAARPAAALALDQDPTYNRLMILGLGHYYNGRLSEAFPAFLKILRDRPEDEAAHYWLARSFFEAELTGLAAVELENYIARHPQGARRAEVEALLLEIGSGERGE